LQVAGRTTENGAGSYENALPAASDASRFVAFYPHLFEELLSDQPLPESDNTQIAGSTLTDWLLREAWKCKTPTELSEQIADYLLAIGLPYSDGQIQTMTRASDDPDSFSTAHLAKAKQAAISS